MADFQICSIPECDKPVRVKSRGWCNEHYQRWCRHGDPNVRVNAPKGEPLRFLRETVLPYLGDDCLRWPFARTADGYGRVYKDGRTVGVAGLVCTEIHGPRPDGHEAAHSCGNGHEGCVTPGHLSWKTSKANSADQLAHGTRNRGERCGRSKLTLDEVREILELKAAGMTLRALADRFNVDFSTVGRIVRRENWYWLDG